MVLVAEVPGRDCVQTWVTDLQCEAGMQPNVSLHNLNHAKPCVHMGLENLHKRCGEPALLREHTT